MNLGVRNSINVSSIITKLVLDLLENVTFGWIQTPWYFMTDIQLPLHKPCINTQITGQARKHPFHGLCMVMGFHYTMKNPEVKFFWYHTWMLSIWPIYIMLRIMSPMQKASITTKPWQIHSFLWKIWLIYTTFAFALSYWKSLSPHLLFCDFFIHNHGFAQLSHNL